MSKIHRLVKIKYFLFDFCYICLNTIEHDNEDFIEDSEELYRELTSIDVDQALYTLKEQTISSDNETSAVLPKKGKSFYGSIQSKNDDFFFFK